MDIMSGKSERLSLFVFIDALGYELLRERSLCPELLAPAQPLGTVFGYSATCIPTILTGVKPRDHGHFSFFTKAAGEGSLGWLRHLRHLPASIVNRGRVRSKLSKAVQLWMGYKGYFQLYGVPFEHMPLLDYTERRDLYEPGGINGGQETIFDDLRKERIPFHLSNWRDSEDNNTAAAMRHIDAAQIRFAYIYYADLDGILHTHGPSSPRVDAQLRIYEKRLRSLVHKARQRYRKVDLVVFSDHGQAEVTERCDLMSRIDSSGLRFGKDYLAVFDSTMARFWSLRPGVDSIIAEHLAAEPGGAVVQPETLAAWGCDFDGHRYGELFFLAHPGVLICPSFMGRTMLSGMHGYEPEHRDSVASLLSSTPLAQVPEGLWGMRSLMRETALS